MNTNFASRFKYIYTKIWENGHAKNRLKLKFMTCTVMLHQIPEQKSTSNGRDTIQNAYVIRLQSNFCYDGVNSEYNRKTPVILLFGNILVRAYQHI